MKVRALPKFEGIRDKERSKKEGKDIFPKAGDIWEVSEERANFLKGHGVIEIIEEDEIEDGTLEHPYKTIMPEPIEEVELETTINEAKIVEKVFEENKPKTNKKKKASKK